MEKFVRAEFQKMKRTFGIRLIWIAPVFSIIIVFLLGGGQNGVYNWWYTMFLPGALTLISSLIVQKDEKKKYRGVLSLPFEKKDVWTGKILYCIICCFITSIIFMIGIVLVGMLYKEVISISQNIIGTILLVLLFMWQIPLCMFLASKFGLFITIIINIFFTMIGVAVFSTTEIWYIFPYSITPRLMAPVLHILPNGLPVPEGSEFLNSNVILPGVLISIVLFIVLSLATNAWFNNREVK
ncbi:lantibiotic immunity ABC transporter MutE/EpiE family permease subunit [Clostridioides difficile]|nr:lantibiotic immunity ABC transporter MutE/EpiE family permease subunit [Clostridioides difficile]